MVGAGSTLLLLARNKDDLEVTEGKLFTIETRPVPRLPRRLSETYGPALLSRFSPWICPQQTRMPSKGQSKDTKAVGTTRLKIALC